MAAPHASHHAPAARYLPVLRTLVGTYFAFLAKNGAAVQEQGLTAPQFDVIATLGNTPGMSCGELCERTLVTKGTLTGVLDRLEAKGLVERVPSAKDRRSIRVHLTRKGERCFQRSFPAVLDAMRPYFARALDGDELATLRRLLTKLKQSFETPLTKEER